MKASLCSQFFYLMTGSGTSGLDRRRHGDRGLQVSPADAQSRLLDTITAKKAEAFRAA